MVFRRSFDGEENDEELAEARRDCCHALSLQ